MLDDSDSDSTVPSDTETICPTPLDSPSTDHPLSTHKLDDHHHGDHTVQFYDTQEYLLNVLTNFIVPVLVSSRDAAVVIAIKDRLDDLDTRLRTRGVPVDEKQRTGQLTMIDAHEMLHKLSNFDDATPISIEPIRSLLGHLDNKFANIYVYGELVNLLCEKGDHTSALDLEEMWNGLMKRHKFTLLCGYDMDNFKDEQLQFAFKDICHSHSRVSPTEDSSYFQNNTNDQDTMIAILNQKAKALQTEINRRKTVEAVLQHYLELMSTRAEQSLRHQQHLYRTLLSFLPVGVYSAPITQAGTNDCDRNSIIVNERFCELVGLSEAQIRINGWFSAVHVNDRDRVRHLHLQDVDISADADADADTDVPSTNPNTPTRRPLGGKEEYRFLLPNNTIRWVTGETVLFPSPPNSDSDSDAHVHKPHHHTYIHTIVDISQLKQVEEQRERASSKAEELLRHRAELAEQHRREQDLFIDTLCHELRNPLSSIQGNVELLQIGQDLVYSILASASSSSPSESLSSPSSSSDSKEQQQPEYLGPADIQRLRTQSKLDLESISAIEKCAAHQKVITDDVLALSKLEVGKVVLRAVEFDPKGTIIDVMRMFEAEAGRKGVRLRSNMPVGDVVVRGDPDRVSQVLINLLANAVKCTAGEVVGVGVGVGVGEKGCITLGLDYVEKVGGRMLVSITVKDTGIGLTKQEKARLFHRFVQPAASASGSTYHGAAAAGGSGLGLVISKGLVELMGGTISVESVKGLGSEFTFTFLAEEVDRSSSACSSGPGVSLPTTTTTAINTGTGTGTSSSPPHPNRRIRHILIVEDNVINQRFLLRLLEAVGYTCATAGNGVEALAYMEEHRLGDERERERGVGGEGGVPDLILMDVHMPVMDGVVCTREIRAREAGDGDGAGEDGGGEVKGGDGEVKDEDGEAKNGERRRGHGPVVIVGLSGNAREEHRVAALRSGMDCYLTKPCRKEELYGVIERFERRGDWVGVGSRG